MFSIRKPGVFEKTSRFSKRAPPAPCPLLPTPYSPLPAPCSLLRASRILPAFVELTPSGANSSIFGTRRRRIGLIFQTCREKRCDNESDLWNGESCFAKLFQKSNYSTRITCVAWRRCLACQFRPVSRRRWETGPQ
jgi:hypothetical protein